MVRLIATLSLIFLTTTGFSEEVLREISWDKALQDGQLPQGKVPGAPVEVAGDRLGVRNTAARPATVGALTLEDPGITSSRYAIVGQVRYEGVEGEGYLEMWSCFGPDERYFTRTLGSVGPMQMLKGSSDWRRFVLPFYNKEDHAPPEKLLVNVVLPGRGMVWLSPLRLVQYGPGEDPLAAPGQWWKDRTAGLIGGVLGSVLGCMGGLIGWLTSRGRARSVVFGMLRAMQVIGAVGMLGGVVALIQSQPYGVYYPLLLIGVLGSGLGTWLKPTTRKRFDEVELRKMSAMDAV